MNAPAERGWWREVTGYQWLVFAIASAGWVFDVYQGQVFNLTRGQMLAELLGPRASPAEIARWGDLLLGVFLCGGTLGGVLFGWLADRWGRKPAMIVAILAYSVFSGATYFAADMTQAAVLRFCVATGVGGEWAVAAALIAEVFPTKARAQAAGIFHATSVLGTWLAAAAGLAFGSHWRLAYLAGVAPALLVLAVGVAVREPPQWHEARAKAARGETAPMGSFRDLLLNPRWMWRALGGMVLAGVGLGTFWGVTVAGQDLAQQFLLRHGASAGEAIDRAKFAYGLVESTGCGLGLVAFGPLCARIGRKPAFIAFQVAALVVVPFTCFAPTSYGMLLACLPVYGFLTLGMQAGFAVYFPELFPSHLRATATGFCFNGGRCLAAAVLGFSSWLKSRPGMDLRVAITLLGLLFVVGIGTALALPETKGRPLPA